MASSTFSDMLKSLYHPDHIFGDEDTWYDAPADLPQQEIEEYFDALEEQDVLFGLSRNKYVSDPAQNYYPILPTVTLNNEIVVFVTNENFRNDAPEYVQLERVCAKLSNLHEDHERDIKVEDGMIDMLIKKLSTAKQTPYELDNIYTGADCKRKRDLIVEKINGCSKTKERLETEYIDNISKLAKEAEKISQKWRNECREREAELAEQKMRANSSDTQYRLQDALREKAQLEGGLFGLRADNELLEKRVDQYQEGFNNLRRVRDGALGEHNECLNRVIGQRESERRRVWKLQDHLKTHREAIIVERRRRDDAQEKCTSLMRDLDGARRESALARRGLALARTRIDYLNHDIDLLKKRLSDKRSWSDELEIHAMKGEVFNRMGGAWEPSIYKRRLEEYEFDEMKERAAKRARCF